MPGMNSDLNPADPTIVNAFRSALMHQLAIIGVILVLLLLCWGASRSWVTARTQAKSAQRAAWHEPRARRLLRVGFGLLWLFDGILQAQPQMAGGLSTQVIQPTATTSPGWVQSLVNWGASLWAYHPITAGAASVWIQVGIGLWLIFGVRGLSSRLAGLASVAWGLIVWAFGEAFGQIFAPGLTVLFGAPGAVLIYAVAGVLVMLPDRAWESARTGRVILACMGAFFAGMALLQAWPGRGFWQGTVAGKPSALASMVQEMSTTSQPHVLTSIVSSFGDFTAAHGFAVNLFAVVVLAGLGVTFAAAALRDDRRLARIGVLAGAVFCLADWVLIEDLGFLGGLGTDPNSMIPLILLFTAGYLALTPATAPAVAAQPQDAVQPAEAAAESAVTAAEPATPAAAQPATVAAAEPTGPGTSQPEETAAPDQAPPDQAPPEEAPSPEGSPRPPRAPRPVPSWLPAPLHPMALRESIATLSLGAVAAIGAVVIILVGAAPMALASVNRTADPITAEAIAGALGPLDTPSVNFTLTSQTGHQVSLTSLRGKVVLLTFLDPVCTTDCPLIAQEMRAADTVLGAKASRTELVAVVANPTYLSTEFTEAFTRQEGLNQVPNWLYLTGSLTQLEKVWQEYGVDVESLPAGAMAAHNDIAYVIDGSGIVRDEIPADPGPGTNATQSSFAVLMANSVLQAMEPLQ